MVLFHPPSPCSAPPSPGRGLPPHCSAFAFPRAAVKPLLSARCQERSKDRGSAQPSQAAGAGEQAQAWLTAQPSLSLPALVHKQWGETQLHPWLGTSPCLPGGRWGAPAGQGAAARAAPPLQACSGVLGVVPGRVAQGLGDPLRFLQRRGATPSAAAWMVPIPFPQGQDEACPVPTGIPPWPPCTQCPALTLQGRHQIKVHGVGVTAARTAPALAWGLGISREQT